MSTQYLIRTIPGKLSASTDGTGGIVLNGMATVGPAANEYWCISAARVSMSQQPQSSFSSITPPINTVFINNVATTYPYCALYVGANSVQDSTTFIDDTNLGSGDTSSVMSSIILTYGDTITAKWRYIPENAGLSSSIDVPILTIYGRNADTLQELQNELPLVPGARFSGATGNASVWTYQISEVLGSGTWASAVPTLTVPSNCYAELVSWALTVDTSAVVGNRYISLTYNIAGVVNNYQQVFCSTAIAANTFANINFAQGVQLYNIPSVTGLGTFQGAPLPNKLILPPSTTVTGFLAGAQTGDLWQGFFALWRLYNNTTNVSYT